MKLVNENISYLIGLKLLIMSTFFWLLRIVCEFYRFIFIIIWKLRIGTFGCNMDTGLDDNMGKFLEHKHCGPLTVFKSFYPGGNKNNNNKNQMHSTVMISVL